MLDVPMFTHGPAAPCSVRGRDYLEIAAPQRRRSIHARVPNDYRWRILSGRLRWQSTVMPCLIQGVESPATTVSGSASVTITVRDAAGRELGRLTPTDTTGGIAVSGRLVGLAPGEHGLHLHTTGRCDPPGFESAGDDWNPTNRQHGTQNPQGPHFGDLPNVLSGPDSVAAIQGVTTAGGSLRSAPDMLLDPDGAALVVHSARDDSVLILPVTREIAWRAEW